jgi:plasmid stabilization system protein ParE
MDFKVIFTETFCKDLEQIIRRIAEHNPEAAEKLGSRIVDSCERLLFFPERYPRVRRRPGFRRLIVGKVYKIFFRVDSERKTVEVVRCWDGRRKSDPYIRESQRPNATEDEG